MSHGVSGDAIKTQQPLYFSWSEGMGGSSYWKAGELEGAYKTIFTRRTIHPSLFSSAFLAHVEFDTHNRLEHYFPTQSKTSLPLAMTINSSDNSSN